VYGTTILFFDTYSYYLYAAPLRACGMLFIRLYITILIIVTNIKIFSYEKKQWKPPSKKEKEEKFQGLSLRKRKACNISSNALMQSIA
jgi:hypothetical protein